MAGSTVVYALCRPVTRGRTAFRATGSRPGAVKHSHRPRVGRTPKASASSPVDRPPGAVRALWPDRLTGSSPLAAAARRPGSYPQPIGAPRARRIQVAPRLPAPQRGWRHIPRCRASHPCCRSQSFHKADYASMVRAWTFSCRFMEEYASSNRLAGWSPHPK